MASPADYVLGHSDLEIERLKLQASIIAPVTRRLIGLSGISRGMTVLDIGCGAGDVSMLLADAVGPEGRVLAIDREARAVETARARAQDAGISHIEFIVTDDDGIPVEHPFDAAFGRYVLVHQRDPVVLLRKAREAVRPGGIVAFHELAIFPPNGFQTWPPAPLFRAVATTVDTTMRATLLCPDFAGRMVTDFSAAGLEATQVYWESIVGGPKSSLSQWLVLTYRVLKDAAAGLQLDDAMIGDATSLDERLQRELTEANAQVISRPQACGFARRPMTA